MSPSDRTPLLPNGGGENGRNGDASARSVSQRLSILIKAEGEPSWTHSFIWFLFDSWFNVLLVFVPLSIISHHLGWDAGLRFLFSFIAIIPLAKLLGDATEQVSAKLGQTLAGLLNASFGNAVEIIVGVAALLQDELRIVQTSMLGSILSNILLVLGCSFLAAGLNFSESSFQATAAQTSASLMTLACITLVIPAAFHSTRENGADNDMHELLVISRGTSIILLGIYVAYLYFQLKSHSDLFTAVPQCDSNGDVIEEEVEEPHMSTIAAGIALMGVTVVTAFCADYLVASIEETAERYHIPKIFIGVILLPLVGNAAEHVTAVWMANKGKMEIAITIAVGSSIQIAVFVVPLLVIVGWITGHDLSLFFANFETITLFASVLLVNLLLQDGKSNYMEGLMLVGLYIVIALAFWVS
ncbi:calcium/proton exchanger [Pleurotus eryngii]|uniref:Vacuolar calcium ion transporter n=1 Tax=Pleurotus eryngii TaxID=5323 RepID=A0A9P6A091_PLEER|nr:calcium/proton exchanger [Pleurotus eryngii]